MSDPDPYYDFWMPYEFKHPSGHSMRLVKGLERTMATLRKQGTLGRLTLKWMQKSDTR